jgi:hypothetical protein
MSRTLLMFNPCRPPLLIRVFLLLVLTGELPFGQTVDRPRIESNVCTELYLGLALLLDIYHLAKPNGFGVNFIGRRVARSQEYDAEPLKQRSQARLYGPRLAAGYPVFSISHRAVPAIYPAQLEDPRAPCAAPGCSKCARTGSVPLAHRPAATLSNRSESWMVPKLPTIPILSTIPSLSIAKARKYNASSLGGPSDLTRMAVIEFKAAQFLLPRPSRSSQFRRSC